MAMTVPPGLGAASEICPRDACAVPHALGGRLSRGQNWHAWRWILAGILGVRCGALSGWRAGLVPKKSMPGLSIAARPRCEAVGALRRGAIAMAAQQMQGLQPVAQEVST